MNIKRDFFTENNLDINNKGQYLEGTMKFESGNYYTNYISNIHKKDKTHYIKIFITVNKQAFNISIINSNGQIVIKQIDTINFTNDNLEISFEVSNLSSGIYFAEICNNSITRTIKFIKK